MTIKVNIQNVDSRHDATIVVKTQNLDGSPVAGMEDKVIGGGSQTERMVHSTQKITIEEVSNP